MLREFMMLLRDIADSGLVRVLVTLCVLLPLGVLLPISVAMGSASAAIALHESVRGRRGALYRSSATLTLLFAGAALLLVGLVLRVLFPSAHLDHAHVLRAITVTLLALPLVGWWLFRLWPPLLVKPSAFEIFVTILIAALIAASVPLPPMA